MRKSKKLGNVYGDFTLVDTKHNKNDTVWIVQCNKCGCLQQKSRHSVERQTTECEQCGNPPKRRNSCGHFRERIYHIYTIMLQRVNNPLKDGYSRYGGRGITVCDEWQNDFMKFYEWSYKNGYTDELTIDRIDNDGNYCPENCRWVNAKKQQNNKSSNKKFIIEGEEKTVAQWADEYKVDRYLVYGRLRAGWDIEKSLTTPVDTKKRSKKYGSKEH